MKIPISQGRGPGSFFWTILVSGTPVQAEKLERSLFKVEKMTCDACAAKIYNRLTQLDGVEGLLINIEKALIAVEHSETLTIDAIMSAMADIDKPARVGNRFMAPESGQKAILLEVTFIDPLTPHQAAAWLF